MSKRAQRDQGNSFVGSILLLSVLLGSFFFVFWLLREPEERLGRAYQLDEESVEVKKSSKAKNTENSSDSTSSSRESKSLATNRENASNSLPSAEVEEAVNQARALRDAGSISESAAILNKMQEADPTSEKLMYERAMLASREQDDPTTAKNLLEKILTQNPAQIEAADELFYAYRQTNDFEGGIQRLKEMDEKASASEKPGIDYVLGRLLVESGQFEEGRTRLEQAVGSGAKDSFIREQLAEAYSRSGMYSKSKETWENLDQEDTPSSSSLNAKSKLAEILQGEGKYDEAEEKLKELLTLDPRHPVALEQLQRLQQTRHPL